MIQTSKMTGLSGIKETQYFVREGDTFSSGRCLLGEVKAVIYTFSLLYYDSFGCKRQISNSNQMSTKGKFMGSLNSKGC